MGRQTVRHTQTERSDPVHNTQHVKNETCAQQSSTVRQTERRVARISYLTNRPQREMGRQIVRQTDKHRQKVQTRSTTSSSSKTKRGAQQSSTVRQTAKRGPEWYQRHGQCVISGTRGLRSVVTAGLTLTTPKPPPPLTGLLSCVLESGLILSACGAGLPLPGLQVTLRTEALRMCLLCVYG